MDTFESLSLVVIYLTFQKSDDRYYIFYGCEETKGLLVYVKYIFLNNTFGDFE